MDIVETFHMADDATLLIKMEVESLVHVRNILVDFEQLSGLSCNVEKTTLMQFGSNEPVLENSYN